MPEVLQAVPGRRPTREPEAAPAGVTGRRDGERWSYLLRYRRHDRRRGASSDRCAGAALRHRGVARPWGRTAG